VITKKNSIWIGSAGSLVLAVVVFLSYRHFRQAITITGAIVVQDKDPHKELPIPGVEIRLASGLTKGPVKSDSSGFFSLRLFKQVRKGQPLVLQFRHPNYQPLDLKETASDKLYIARMVPIARNTVTPASHSAISIGNVRVRYSIKAQRLMNIGSAVKTFEVQNVGNVPCGINPVCSPDGKWKAAVGSMTLEAGPGNDFHNVRVSCIAGPCPFTRIDADDFSRGGPKISVTVRDWSETATFVMEAEVTHSMASETDYTSYPVIFGSALTFTMPSQAEGVSLEADVAGETIIFPLGPALILSWANCNAETREDQTQVFRCEAKPGYRLQ
jgi:hypothetical protein